MRWLLVFMCLSFASMAQAQGPTLAPGARPYTWSERLRLRDSQVDILRAEKAQKRLGGPIAALMISSGAASAWFALFAANATYADLPAAVLSPLGIIGVAGTIGSAVWLGKVVHDRRGLQREIRRLEHKRFGPDGLSAALGPKQSMLTYTLRF